MIFEAILYLGFIGVVVLSIAKVICKGDDK